MLRNAIEAARLLVGYIENKLHQSEHDERVVPHAIAAVLALTRDRAGRLIAAVEGDLDPREILAPENEMEPGALSEGDEDVFLRPWSAKRRLRQAKATIRRARLDLAESGSVKNP